MSLIVQKFGGTSVRNIDCIRLVTEKIIAARQAGHDLVVVVSAMAGETDRLERLAFAASDNPDSREMDVLLATGEQITIALLAMMLLSKGVPARSYTGGQVAIQTDSIHTKARIIRIDVEKIRQDLIAGQVVIVAGFQGIDALGDITTLGRGGSDTTAVAIAAALDADECQIYTDVTGIYTVDPRLIPEARRLDRITYQEMLELSSLGAKVLQMRSVEFASQYRVPLRVLSTFESDAGTLVTDEDNGIERAPVCGIAVSRAEAILTIRGLPNVPGVAARILGPISDAYIEVDMITQQSTQDGRFVDLHFTVNRRDYTQTHQILSNIASDVGATISGDDTVAKISLVGIGLRSHVGIASQMFKLLGLVEIPIHMVTTSEIKVSVVVSEKDLEPGVQALHTGFQLQGLPAEETRISQSV